MDVRSTAARHDETLNRRLDQLVPNLLEKHGLDAWVIVAREYNEDPVAATMLPYTWHRTARRRTILAFKDRGRQRAAMSRYPVGTFPSEWDPSTGGDQWAALAGYLSDVDGPVGINVSATFALADGLTSAEHRRLVTALEEHTLVPAEHVAIGWLETRLPEEVAEMAEACAIAHGLLRRALSDEAVTPGVTTTEDVAWWLTERSHEAGFQVWFHPGVTVQRRGDDIGSPADGTIDRVIQPADLLHIDFGIVRNGYHTDQQQHAYVLAPGETTPPEAFVAGIRQGNRLQDLLMAEMRAGRSGNDALRSTLERAGSEGIRPIVYTHPIGLHGHAAGSTIGLWDAQDGVPGTGDYPINMDTGWSIELAVEIDVAEWAGQRARIMLEEDAFLGADGARFLDGRQEELWLIGS